MNSSKLIIIVLISIIINVNSAMEFQISLKEYSRTCFSQHITKSSPVRFKVQSTKDNKQFSVTALFKDNIIFKNHQLTTSKKIDHYASESGLYQFCIQNLSIQNQPFKISFLNSLELSDLDALPKQSDSDLIKLMVNKINQLYQQAKDQEQYSLTMNEYNMQLQKLVSFKSVGFGFLSITVVLIISFLHYLEIKRVLRNRKVI